MRKRRGGISPFTVGVVALVVTLVGVYLGFTKSIPFRSHYEVKAAFKSANNLRNGSPVRIAGVEVGKVTKVERGAQGRRGRGRDDADPGQGPPAARRRAVQDPPAHLPRGQLLRRRQPGHGRQGGRRQPHVPGPADRHPGPARRGADRAADRHARGPQDAAARVRGRPARQGREGLQRLDPVLEAGLPRLGDRLRGDAGREGARPLRLHRPRRRGGRRARPQPRAAQGPGHELPRHGRRVRPRERQPRGGDRRAAAHAARRPARARRAQRLVPRPPRLRPRHAARASRTPRRRSTSRCRSLQQLRGLVSEEELRGLAADLRPTVPALASFTSESVPLSKQARGGGELPERGRPAVDEGQARRREVPVHRAGLHRAAQAVPRPGGREPLR